MESWQPVHAGANHVSSSARRHTEDRKKNEANKSQGSLPVTYILSNVLLPEVPIMLQYNIINYVLNVQTQELIEDISYLNHNTY